MITILDYLESNGINKDTEDLSGVVYTMIKEADVFPDYRNASLIFADDPILFTEFIRIWNQYESSIDFMEFEKRHPAFNGTENR